MNFIYFFKNLFMKIRALLSVLFNIKLLKNKKKLIKTQKLIYAKSCAWRYSHMHIINTLYTSKIHAKYMRETS